MPATESLSSPSATPLARPRGPVDSFFSLQADAERTAILAFPLAALMVGALLWLSAGILTFHDDAAQYISTASHIMAGDGAVTSVLYYENQLVQQAPAAQTVWPAGFPAVTAMLATIFGLEVPRALLLVGILAHIGTAVSLTLVLRLVGLNPWLSLAGGLFWLLNVTSWLNVTRGLSDPLYQFFSIAVAVAIAAYFGGASRSVSSQRNRSGQFDQRFGRESGVHWLLLASAMTAGALLVRYQAVALLAPLVMALTLSRYSHQSMRSRLLAGSIALVPVLVLLALLIARNWELTGTITGGADAGRGQTFAEVAARISWAPQVLQVPVLIGLLASCLICVIGAMILWVRDSQSMRTRAAFCPAGARAVLVYCLAAYACNVGLLLVLSLTSTAYVIELRYLGVCFMFLITPAIWLAVNCEWYRVARGQTIRLGQHAASGLIALATVGQLIVLQQPYLDRLASADPGQLNQILSTSLVNDRSALAWLQGQRDPRPVLMSTHAHSLSLLTETTVIGVPVPVYTEKPWSEAQIYSLAKRHDVKYLVAFRGLDTWVYRDLINKMLDENSCPQWLQPVVASPDLVIARIGGTDIASRNPIVDSKGAKTCKLPIPPARSTIRSTASSGARIS